MPAGMGERPQDERALELAQQALAHAVLAPRKRMRKLLVERFGSFAGLRRARLDEIQDTLGQRLGSNVFDQLRASEEAAGEGAGPEDPALTAAAPAPPAEVIAEAEPIAEDGREPDPLG